MSNRAEDIFGCGAVRFHKRDRVGLGLGLGPLELAKHDRVLHALPVRIQVHSGEAVHFLWFLMR